MSKSSEVTVADLIEILKTQDQGAVVQVLVHTEGTGYYDQGGSCSPEEFNKEDHIEYTDFRGNEYVKPNALYFNKRYLLLGEKA